MSSEPILHALCLHLYQPAGNLNRLVREDPAALKDILLCYERFARLSCKYASVARLHIALSPLLIEQLRDPDLIAACREIADLPAILDAFRSTAAIEPVGTGYRHAPLPLIPRDDWDEQLGNERALMETVLGRVPRGYWAPAGMCVPEMIPALVRAGYEYLLLPSDVLALPDGGDVDPYRAYLLCHDGDSLPVVPQDGGFSRAQESEQDVAWFADSVRDGVAQAPASDAPYLLSTGSDGENGEWFRSADEAHGFFGRFFSPYMEFCETGEFPVRPVFLSEYLRRFRPATVAELRTAQGHGAADQAMRDRLAKVSARYWSLARSATGASQPSRQALAEARALVLNAEDSGLLLGGASASARTLELLTRAEALMRTKNVRRPLAGAGSDPTRKKQRKQMAVVSSATQPAQTAAATRRVTRKVAASAPGKGKCQSATKKRPRDK